MRRAAGRLAAAVVLGGAMLLGGGAARAQVSLPVDRSELAGTVAGRVCLDVDGDGACAAGEPGQAGVRLVLGNGQSVVTDAQGRYHVVALEARVPLPEEGGRFTRGRHRLKVDVRSLPPGLGASPAAATVEVPLAGLALQDFALAGAGASEAAGLALDYGASPPRAGLSEAGLTFLVAGRTSPGARVRVAGRSVEVDADGRYRADVSLSVGRNLVDLTVEGPGAGVRLFRQRIDVVEREGSLLVVPRTPEAVASLALPGEVAAGRRELQVRAAPGTRVRGPLGEQEAGEDGLARVQVQLAAGANSVPLELLLPDGTTRREALAVTAAQVGLAVGLLDAEVAWDVRAGRLRLEGSGAAHVEQEVGPWQLSGELALQSQDVDAVSRGGVAALLAPRRPDRFQRALEAESAPLVLGDASTTLTPNAAEGRLRLEARHPGLGVLGFGSHRAQLDGAEVGRYHRPGFGPYAQLGVRLSEALSVGGTLALDAGLADPTRALATRQAHEELRATGGSLYYLRHAFLAEGSERVRVEVRDGMTGLVLAEQHLVRGRDYEVDARAGRILLSRPLSFVSGASLLQSDPLVAAPEPVLLVDYAYVAGDASPVRALEGEVTAGVLGAEVGVGGVEEQGQGSPYRLLRARARVPVGGASLLVEAARSQGSAWREADFLRSDDGGLDAWAVDAAGLGGGDALTVRLKGRPLPGLGRVDAAWRVRTPGFSDGAHADLRRFRQASLWLEQPLGPLTLTLLGDDREGAATGGLYAGRGFEARTLGAGVGVEQEAWGARLEVRDEALALEEEGSGARSAVGLSGRYRLHERLTLRATHRQVVATRGSGPGARDDTFSSLGADVLLEEGMRLGVRGGWGPVLGPLAWLEGEVRRGADTYYGAFTVDVDGPDVGTGRAVSGARTEVGDGSTVYVEDVRAHDAEAVRLSRAVGGSQQLPSGWSVFARYERGVRDPLGVPSPLTRDAGGAGVSLVAERLRVGGRFELRREEGPPGPGATPPRLQRLLSLAAEVLARDDLTLGGRVNASDTLQGGAPLARLLEGSVGLAWRPGPFALVGRYAINAEQPPPERGGFGERTLHVLSLLPAVQLSDRWALAAGAHLGVAREADTTSWVLSGALRPSVRLWGNLELAGEVAGRSAAPDGGALAALRAEVGLRLDERARLAVGYTVFGYSGLGLTAEEETGDRVYLRAELAY